MRLRFLFAALASLTLWAGAPASPALAQSAPQAGAQQARPQFQQVKLTADGAKSAIDAFLAVREKYGDDPFGGKKVTADQLKDSETGRGILDILAEHGYDDPDLWSRTIQSVGFAYGAAQDDNLADARKSLAEVENDKSIPDSVKKQMITMLKGIIPSENNMEVLKALQADPKYKTAMDSLYTPKTPQN